MAELHEFVTITFNDNDEKKSKGLSGKYLLTGRYQGKKVYKKEDGPPGYEKAALYYWGFGSGPDYQGWHLGDRPGGMKMWGTSKACGDEDAVDELPPNEGWDAPLTLEDHDAEALAPEDPTVFAEEVKAFQRQCSPEALASVHPSAAKAIAMQYVALGPPSKPTTCCGCFG